MEYRNYPRTKFKVVSSPIEFPENIDDNMCYAGGEFKTFMAPSLNWCGAQLPNSNPTNGGNIQIESTDDLLELINNMQKEIYALSAAVIALANK